MSDLLIITPSGSLTGDKTFAGAKATFFDAGTTTPATVYSDDALTIPHASPLVAGADGLWPEIFVSGASFKAVVVYSDDTTCYTLDPCPKSSAFGSAASSISFAPTVGLPYNNVQSAIVGLEEDLNALETDITGALSRRLISTRTIAGDASLDFTSAVLTAASGMYEIEFDNVVPATSNSFLSLRTSTDGGSTFDAGSTDYEWAGHSAIAAVGGTTDNVVYGELSRSSILLTTQGTSNTSADGGLSGTVKIKGIGQSRKASFIGESLGRSQAGSLTRDTIGGFRKSTTAVNGLRLLMNTGAMSGTFSLYEVIR